MFFGDGDDHVEIIVFCKFIDAIFHIFIIDKMILRDYIFQRRLK